MLGTKPLSLAPVFVMGKTKPVKEELNRSFRVKSNAVELMIKSVDAGSVIPDSRCVAQKGEVMSFVLLVSVSFQSEVTGVNPLHLFCSSAQ